MNFAVCLSDCGLTVVFLRFGVRVNVGMCCCEARGIRLRAVQPGKLFNSFYYLLLETEKQRLNTYSKMWHKRYGVPAHQDIDCFVHLGDKPERFCCWTGSGKFPVLRKSMGIIYHPSSQTILTGQERLAAQGWPVCHHHALAARIQPFQFPTY